MFYGILPISSRVVPINGVKVRAVRGKAQRVLGYNSSLFRFDYLLLFIVIKKVKNKCKNKSVPVTIAKSENPYDPGARRQNNKG